MKKLFLSLAFLLPMMGTMAQTQVKTAEGILEGKDLSGIKVFKGVPFAAPPVGNLRWKAPQPAKHWDGVREAKEYGPNPMQEPLFGDMNFGTKVNSEDCLYLNIWTPAKTMKEEYAIMFDNRNADWVAKMPAIMSDKPTFFAVGAGHLPGEKGVLNLLKLAGYEVDAVK